MSNIKMICFMKNSDSSIISKTFNDVFFFKIKSDHAKVKIKKNDFTNLRMSYTQKKLKQIKNIKKKKTHFLNSVSVVFEQIFFAEKQSRDKFNEFLVVKINIINLKKIISNSSLTEKRKEKIQSENNNDEKTS